MKLELVQRSSRPDKQARTLLAANPGVDQDPVTRFRCADLTSNFYHVAGAVASQYKRGRKFPAQPTAAFPGVEVQAVQPGSPDPDFDLVGLYLRFRSLPIGQYLRARRGLRCTQPA